MRLRHIEVFHAVMQAGTISGAAQLLHVTQPAATKALQHCELQLGMPLFDRVRGKLDPTPEAQRLFIEIDKLHRDLVSIRRLAANLKSGEAEHVRLVTTPALATAIVPAAMPAWCEAFPRARCSLATHHTREIVSALLLGEADVALSLQDPRHPGIKAEVIAGGSMVALCPIGSHEAAGSGALSLGDIRSEIIGLQSDDPLAGLLHHAGEAAGLPLASRITVQTYQLARAVVEAGVGMTLVDPFTAASADLAKVKVRPLTPQVSVNLHVLSAASAPPGQAARRLVKFIGNAAHEHLSRLP